MLSTLMNLPAISRRGGSMIDEQPVLQRRGMVIRTWWAVRPALRDPPDQDIVVNLRFDHVVDRPAMSRKPVVERFGLRQRSGKPLENRAARQLVFSDWSSTRPMTTWSGARLPSASVDPSSRPSALPAATAVRSVSPVEIRVAASRSAKSSPCVPSYSRRSEEDHIQGFDPERAALSRRRFGGGSKIRPDRVLSSRRANHRHHPIWRAIWIQPLRRPQRCAFQ
jgi:hypothetical protein